MPCNSDYLNPTQRELEMREAAILLVWACQQIGRIPPGFAVKEAKNIYAKDERSVTELYALLRALSQHDIELLVYNARDKMSRKLADWWEDHQEADRKREKKERDAVQRRIAASRGLAKLSDDEKIALGLEDKL